MTDPIDPNAFSTLLDSIGGDKEFLADLISTYLKDAPVQFSLLHSSLADEAAEIFRRAAHSLKSNAASFGALTLASLCKQLEELGKSGHLGSAGALLAEAEAEYGRVKSALEEMIK